MFITVSCSDKYCWLRQPFINSYVDVAAGQILSVSERLDSCCSQCVMWVDHRVEDMNNRCCLWVYVFHLTPGSTVKTAAGLLRGWRKSWRVRVREMKPALRGDGSFTTQGPSISHQWHVQSGLIVLYIEKHILPHCWYWTESAAFTQTALQGDNAGFMLHWAEV